MTQKILIGVGVIAIIWAIWYFGFRKKGGQIIIATPRTNITEPIEVGPTGEESINLNNNQ